MFPFNLIYFKRMPFRISKEFLQGTQLQSSLLLFSHTIFSLACLMKWVIIKLSVTPRFLVRPDWRIQTGFGRETIYWDSLPDFFLYYRIKISYTYKKNYHRSGVHQSSVHQNLYTFTESHLQIQNCTFTFTNQSAEPTRSEPLLVCWPSNMQKFSDVFSCTYKD